MEGAVLLVQQRCPPAAAQARQLCCGGSAQGLQLRRKLDQVPAAGVSGGSSAGNAACAIATCWRAKWWRAKQPCSVHTGSRVEATHFTSAGTSSA